MYLYSGKKVWWFIEPAGAAQSTYRQNPHFDDAELQWLKNANYTDIIYKGYKIHTAITNDGDFIYFPQAWLHRVVTHKKTIGCGGYL
jgi:hypothetical protein